jgi:hypothetical protein
MENKNNSSGSKVEITKRTNFMQNAFGDESGENVIKKREEFAVNLRKQKTKQLI